VVSLFYATVMGRVPFSADDVSRIGWMVALSVLYTGFFLGLGLSASCWVRRSATAMAACLFCWVILALAVPNVVPLFSAQLAPIPPKSKMMLETKAIAADINNTLVAGWQEEAGESGRYRDVSEMWGIDILPRIRTEHSKREAALMAGFTARMNRQIRLTQMLSRFSPTAAYTYAATNVAGTGIQDFLDQTRSLDRYKVEFVSASTRLERAAEAKREAYGKWLDEHPGQDAPRPNTAYKPGDWPQFVRDRIPLATALSSSLPDIIWLACGTVLLFLFAVAGFARNNVDWSA
jgi:ABC-type transport system involved in multi-copper enzyme maturation permease subunit